MMECKILSCRLIKAQQQEEGVFNGLFNRIMPLFISTKIRNIYNNSLEIDMTLSKDWQISMRSI